MMRMLRYIMMAGLLALMSTHAGAQMYWNSAADFQSTQYIAVPPDAVLDLQGDYSVECWVNLDSFIEGLGQDILAKRQYAKSSGYQIGFSQGRLKFGSGLATRPVVAGQWWHVGATYSASAHRFSIYLNGVLDTTWVNAAAGPPAINTDSLYIGYFPTVGQYGQDFIPFHGKMDDLRIWSRELSATEIARFWRMTLGPGTGTWYEGLELSYTFDRAFGGIPTAISAIDRSGNHRTGTVHRVGVVYRGERPPLTVADHVALDLDGNGDYVAGPSTAAINVSGSFTLECWVYPRTIPSFSTLIQKREGSNATGYTLYLDHNRPAIRTASLTRLLSGTALPAGEWSHVAATYDAAATQFSIYINGVQDTMSTVAAPPVPGTDSLYIGSGFNGGFNGYIDEVRIHSFVRTEAQIAKDRWVSIDHWNEPAPDSVSVVYGFDGILADDCNDGGPPCSFRGDAHFTTSWYGSAVPEAPLVRSDANAFPDGFHLKASTRRIPNVLTSGLMVPDSLYVPGRILATINDIELFVALNHPSPEALTITLVSPARDSLVVFKERGLSGASCNVITIFDDDADTALTSSSRLLGFGPTIRPAKSLRGTYTGSAMGGYWKLLIDDGTLGGVGRLYAWGLRFNNSGATGMEEATVTPPAEFALAQNFPNPFNPATSIRLTVAERARTVLSIYDVLGRRVAVLVDAMQDPGTYTFRWDAHGQASGMYICRASAGDRVLSMKMLLIK